ncbi:inhibitor of apoptosis repeat-containing protein [Neolentinus lepideus HHB14362 ss-1]|uniref:Inhibitor of apoptosis repeat-containing protein n=1 Tax=Neolentinus lepideus HHB14362 ss-1 TaxID=1314782 RepID=A0A165PEA2_9AGAM|nr:inhibitor of apoptosis repeat-containing protein [Neolentinus lepideus HHB14362 ss-1]
MASMQVLQDRIDSFKPKRTTKKSSSSQKWPHSASFKAIPQSLAEAGFYFTPWSEDKDNVTCYMCKKQLNDWDKEDDPFNVHWEKCRDSCAWAAVRCGLEEDVDGEGNFIATDPKRLPTSKAMEKARLETFRAFESWPHDAVKGHGANSKKMAKAGFVYTPQSDGDDTASCLYCDISLSGWDPEDEPMCVHSPLLYSFQSHICSLVTSLFFTTPLHYLHFDSLSAVKNIVNALPGTRRRVFSSPPPLPLRPPPRTHKALPWPLQLRVRSRPRKRRRRRRDRDHVGARRHRTRNSKRKKQTRR